MCVRENTAQAASVEFLRMAQKLCAQQTASLLSEKPGGFFDSLSTPGGMLLRGDCHFRRCSAAAGPSTHFSSTVNTSTVSAALGRGQNSPGFVMDTISIPR